MICFSAKDMTLSFGDVTILDSIRFQISENDKIGIIGNNGAGKTSLLKLFSGEYKETSGELFIHSQIAGSIGYLKQNSGLESDESVMNEFMKPFKELDSMKERLEWLENCLKNASDDEERNNLSARLSELYDRFKASGGLTYENRVRSILKGLGFSEESWNLPVSSLSGGQKTRLALGRLLLDNPMVLMLDEPTNHLDSDSVQWLQNELKSYKGTLVVISHDRYFLDCVTEKTLLIENGSAFMYNAPYSKYAELRNADLAYNEKCYIQQQKEIARINAFIQNQRKWNRERNIIAAESRIKYLDRMTVIDKPRRPDDPPPISFDIIQPGGRDVLKVNSLGFSYPGKMLFENLSFEVFRGEHVFISGPNGCGKSTFLKIITGNIPDDDKKYISGDFRLGSTVPFSYYAQDLSGLNTENTVFDEIYEHANQGRNVSELISVTRIRSALAAFGFKGEDVFRQISLLSGGEKSRLELLKISYDKSSLLILDEPTNHLDIGTREVLEKALSLYKGTMIVVSHDRYFTEKLATRIIDISSFGSNHVPGTADESNVINSGEIYRQDKEKKAKLRKMRSDLEKSEKRLEDLSVKVRDIDIILENPDNQSDYSLISAKYTEKEEIETEMLEIMETIDKLKNDLQEE